MFMFVHIVICMCTKLTQNYLSQFRIYINLSPYNITQTIYLFKTISYYVLMYKIILLFYITEIYRWCMYMCVCSLFGLISSFWMAFIPIDKLICYCWCFIFVFVCRIAVLCLQAISTKSTTLFFFISRFCNFVIFIRSLRHL